MPLSAIGGRTSAMQKSRIVRCVRFRPMVRQSGKTLGVGITHPPSLVPHAPADGETNQLNRVLQAQLSFDVGSMRLDGLDAHLQLKGEGRCAHAAADQIEYFEFPVRE